MIILETFQGWGAVFYPKVLLKKLKSFVRKIILSYVLMKCSQDLQEQEKVWISTL